MDTSCTLLSANHYLPYGQLRTDTTISQTDLGYTGQRNYSDFELMDYNARFYSSYQNHFAQPDPIIPNLTSSIGLNRYAYANNNPILYNDPTGNLPDFPLSKWIINWINDISEAIYNIKNAEPVYFYDNGNRSPSPTSYIMDQWLVDRINENNVSESTQRIKGRLDFSDGINIDDLEKGMTEFVSQVRGGAILDYKADIRLSGVLKNTNGNVQIGGLTTNFQAVANFAFGAYTNQIGMHNFVSQCGAGGFQVIENDRSGWGPLRTCFDEEFDNYYIKAGSEFWELYGEDGSVTTVDLNIFIRNYVYENGTPPDPANVGNYK